ncbi:MAG: hypothetical protein ACKV2Q_05805 [Planctomycetaceae bacterium]
MTISDVKSNRAELCKVLAEWKAKASAAGDDSLVQMLVDQERELHRLENDTIKPARLGIVGRFSAGKTRLLEAWLGCGGMLPVAENPTTGNIVEFHLQRCSDIGESRLRDWQVQIVDVQSANLILDRLLKAAVGLMQLEWRDGLPLLNRALDEKSPTRWVDATNWALQAHAPEHTEKLQAVAFEVYRFALVYEKARKLAGKVLVASAQHADRLMTLQFDPQQFYSGNLRDLRLSLPTITDNFSLDALTDEQVLALFPVVRKIIVSVDLPDPVADCITSDREINFQIVDCPGAGADGTSVRDEMLCALELRETDGIVALIDARNPGDSRDFINEIKRLWGAQGKERVLAVISRFDQMPVSDGDARMLAELANGSGPLSLDELRAACARTFFVLLSAARQTVLNGEVDRVALMSAMAYIDAAHVNGISLGTQQFLIEQIDNSEHYWIAKCEQWQAIGERLQQGATTPEEQAIARLLVEFAQDGGGHRLSSIVEEHMQRVGDGGKAERLKRDWDAFLKTQDELEQLVADLVVVVEDVVKQRSATSIATAAQRVGHAFNVVGSALALAPLELTLRPKGKQKAVAVRPVLRREAIGMVCDWAYWRDTLNAIDPDREPNMIPIVAAKTLPVSDAQHPQEIGPTAPAVETANVMADSRRELLRRRQIPVRSSDFEKPFFETCERLNVIVRSTLKAVLASTIDNIGSRVAEQMGPSRDDWLQRLVAATTDEDFLKRLGTDRENFRLAVELAADEERLSKDLDGALEAVFSKASQLADGFFPLQRKRDGSHAVTYPWYEPVNSRFGRMFEPRHRHLMRLFRLRSTLIDATIFYLGNILHQLQDELRRVVRDRLEFIEHELDAAARLEPVVITDVNLDELF